LLIVPLVLVIIGALILAAQGTYENMRFAQATQQLLGLVSIAHDAAVRQSDFATQQGQDVLAALSHAGQITTVDDNGTAKIINPWQGAVHGSVAAPSVLRVDMDVPVRDCRRLALFFAGATADLNLAGMQAQTEPGSGWTVFYKETDLASPGADAIEAACGQKARVTLALDFRLR
jgi:hypothetical protein